MEGRKPALRGWLLAGCLGAALCPAGPVQASSATRIDPSELVYRGAFRLPEGGERPLTFAYGGNASTYDPTGDAAGGPDGWPGSLFVSGHDRLPYGELTSGGQIAEVNIPAPVVTSDVALLPVADFVQGFHDVAYGWFPGLDEIPRLGLQYLDHPATGPRIHIAWGQHFQEEPSQQLASHAMFGRDLSDPGMQGAWFVGSASLYSVNDYLLEVPAVWADAHASGRRLGTGRYRDGGWSGKGPALFAYVPWLDAGGTLPAANSQLAATTLLLYESSQVSADPAYRSASQYQHADEWAGGAWITLADGRSALAFAGTKGTGAKYWYGWVNPAGPEVPCVETEPLVGCFLASGASCPPEDLLGCSGHNDSRGWWSSSFRGQILLYDPDDLAQVAAGTLDPWSPQPYATIDIEPHLFGNPSGVEPDMLGTGVQRRFKIGAVAFDRQRGDVFVLELFADETRPVVHVFSVAGARRAGTDLDGDGRTDLLWRHGPSGGNAAWLMNGASTRAAGLLPTVGAPWETVDAGDLDGDGKADVLWREPTSGVNAVWFMNGTAVASSALLPPVASPWAISAAGDFDGDGRADLLWTNPGTGESAVWLMNGASVLAGALLPTVGPTWAPRVGDLSGDGRADVLWFDPTSGLTAMWLLSGTAVVGGAYGPTVGGGWQPRALADLDGDGKADVLWRDEASGSNAVWFMNGTAVASASLLPAVGSPWTLGAVGDLDGDARADLVWRQGSTGENAVWFMSGSHVAAAAYAPAVADGGWGIALP